MKHFVNYLFIRILTLPFRFLPFKAIHFCGNLLGNVSYFMMPQFRKRAFSNIASAKIANGEKEIRSITKKSFQNLMITCLEYAKFAGIKKIGKIAHCQNPEEANSILQQGKGVIFFCGHQANWEVLFLEGTSRMPGVAIGRPVKNKYLYDWVLSIREKFGGKIITPKNAIKESLRALKNGFFLGIVGDQGMPDSGFSSPFFGRNAWTSPMPAILAFRTGTPIIVATTIRKKGQYFIHYSPPIWPLLQETMEKEIDRMMRLALSFLEESIRENPGQWLWQHNRWKQQTREKLKKRFRHESICILLPKDKNKFERMLPHLLTLRLIYPHEFLTFVIPKDFSHRLSLENIEIYPYETEEQLLLNDFRFKLIFDFAEYKPAKSHYHRLSAFEVVTIRDLQKLAPRAQNLSDILREALLQEVFFHAR